MQTYVVKLGADWYKNGIDKNGGKHEHDLIVSRLRKMGAKPIDIYQAINKLFSLEDVLIVISGLEVLEGIQALKCNIERTGVRTVLVLCDLRVTELSPQMCDIPYNLVLTQALKPLYNLACLNQKYSYVPELFLDNLKQYKVEEVQRRHSCLVFGGTIDGRLKKFERYILNNPYAMCFVKHAEAGVDQRLSYNQFHRVMELNKYTLVFSDEICKGEQFVTPRFVEALNNNQIPFVDADYDPAGHFISPDSFLVVRSQQELIDKITTLEFFPDMLIRVLNELNIMKDNIWSNKRKFADTLIDFIIGG